MKGQSSIEYLTTYGWMVLAAGLAAGALYPTVDMGCNIQVQDDFGGDLVLEQVGVAESGELLVRIDSETDREVFVENINFTDGTDSIEVLQPRNIAPGAEITYPVGNVEKTGSCQTYDLNISFSKGPLEGQTKNIRVQGSLNLIESFVEYLRQYGDQIGSLSVNASIMPTNSDICIGANCAETDGSSVYGPDDYVNQSGDEMAGTLKTNQLEANCYGANCTFTKTMDEGFVSSQNNSLNATLNVTEIKPITDICLGKCN